MGGRRDGLDNEESIAGAKEPKDRRRLAETSEHSLPPYPTAETPDLSVRSQEHTTPVSETQLGSEKQTKELLAAYQETLEVVEDLPAVVWVRWSGNYLGRFLKVPYLRWFLRYFLTHHMHKSLSTLDRRLHAIAALASDPDLNKANREVVKLYLQSLPPPPYRSLAFAVVFAALLVALPLRGFGDVFQVLDIVGAIMRFDISLVARAFAAKELGATVRAMLVLLLGFSVVAFLLSTTFGLKRMLFNLYPASKERIGSTAARDHALSVEGLYALEDSVFDEFGLRRPKEGRGDLLLQTFVLMLLLLLSMCLGVLALFFAMSWDLTLEVTTEAPANVNVTLPEVHWTFYAVPAIIFLVAFVVHLKRLIIAWRKRNRPASD